MKKVVLALFLITLAIVVGLFFRKRDANYREEALKSTKQTWGVLLKSPKCKGCMGSYYFFYNEWGDSITFNEPEKIFDIKIGDTVWIKYSTKDNTIAEVVDPFYMKK